MQRESAPVLVLEENYARAHAHATKPCTPHMRKIGGNTHIIACVIVQDAHAIPFAGSVRGGEPVAVMPLRTVLKLFPNCSQSMEHENAVGNRC